MKRGKDKDIEAGKESLSYDHNHKVEKRYDDLLNKPRRESIFTYQNEKT